MRNKDRQNRLLKAIVEAYIKDVRPVGRVSQGVIGINLDNEDEVNVFYSKLFEHNMVFHLLHDMQPLLQ